MHAVVVNLTITDPDAAERALREQLVPRISQAPGFVAGYWTVKGSAALSMFMFETEEAANLMSRQAAAGQLNLALKFLLELAALGAFGLWGASIGHGWTAVLLAIGLPVVAAGLWGMLAVPKARHRLPLRLRAPFELGVFAVAALALWQAESVTPAAIFAAVALVNAVGWTAFDQWDA
jgi:Protein of unknown function (DUF2568)